MQIVNNFDPGDIKYLNYVFALYVTFFSLSDKEEIRSKLGPAEIFEGTETDTRTKSALN